MYLDSIYKTVFGSLVNTYSDKETKLKEILANTKLENLHRRCEQEGVLKEYYFEVVDHPKPYLDRCGFFTAQNQYKPLGFTECACTNGAFDRLKSPRRVQLENQIIADLTKEKDQTIHLLSMGSGGLLQDWILVGRLLKAGYTSIKIALVNPKVDFEFDRNEELYRQFPEFFKKLEDTDVEVSVYESVEQIEPQKRFDAVMAIDFDDFLSGKKVGEQTYRYACEDLFTAKELLHENGHLYLGRSDEDLVIDATSRIATVGKPGVHTLLSKHICEKKENVTLAVSQFIGALYLLLPIVSKLVENGVENIQLTFVGKDSPFGHYPSVQAIENSLKKYCPKGVTLNAQLQKNLDEQARYDYLLTGELESLAKTPIKPLLTENGVGFVAMRPGPINKITKSDTTCLNPKSSSSSILKVSYIAGIVFLYLCYSQLRNYSDFV